MHPDQWSRRKTLVLVLLCIHAALLAWSSKQHSPTFNEIGHVPAGICHWQYQMFHLYRVNPPLPRLVATVPLLCANPKTNWDNYGTDPFSREIIPMGIRFAKANGADTFRLFTIARWACIPFAVLGAWLCCRWAFELWGGAAGMLSLALWCFSPFVLGHGALVMPDVPAAAMGIAASYLFWCWLKEPCWHWVIAVGAVLGLAQLCKTTLLVLFVVWPVLWLVFALSRRDSARVRRWFTQGAMLCTMFVIALLVLNLGYGFVGSFRRLGDFEFQSRLLSGRPHDSDQVSGNRFANTLMGSLPVPVPGDYLQGIDRQRTDFEEGSRSYLRGKWSERGWWYYYLYALGVKVPLGTWALMLLAVGMTIFGARGKGTVPDQPSVRTRSDENRDSPQPASWRDEMVVLAPGLVVLIFVSSQTGFSVHSRYVIPALPFLFIWISKVGRVFAMRPLTRNRRVLAAAVVVALALSVTSSVWAYPHSLSYFNELAGGAKGGHVHLLDSNIAWGQDLLYLKGWLDQHPKVQPFPFASFGWIDPRFAGIESTLPPIGPRFSEEPPPTKKLPEALDIAGPQPGWYAIDVNFLHGTHWASATGDGRWTRIPVDGWNYEYFLNFQPVAMAGYSIYIYHVTLDEANRVRRELGLPELPASDAEAEPRTTEVGPAS